MPDTVLITGAGRGLGYWLSKKFLENKYFLIALNKIKSADFDKLAADHPGKTAEFIADISDEQSVIKACKGLKKISEKIDILINNAGIHPEPSNHKWKHIDDLSDVILDTVKLNLSVNAYGPLLVVKHCLPFLKNGRQKLIVNISSEAGSIAQCYRKDEFGYCMSKAALNMQSKILQNRLLEFDLKVIAVHPGWMKTDMGGPEASDYPEVCAERITALALRKWKKDDPIYMDNLGNPLTW